jgi:hypothetical protein
MKIREDLYFDVDNLGLIAIANNSLMETATTTLTTGKVSSLIFS